MSENKCVCHINDFEIKDASARRNIEKVKKDVDGAFSRINDTDRRLTSLVANEENTEGNTELIDIRFGHSGHSFPTAGDAVRNQFANISKHFYNFNLFEPGTDTTWIPDNSGQTEGKPLKLIEVDDYKGSPAIAVKPETWYTSNASEFTFLTDTGHYISSVKLGTSSVDMNTFVTPTACAFIRFSWNTRLTVSQDIYLFEGQGVPEYEAELSEKVKLSSKHLTDAKLEVVVKNELHGQGIVAATDVSETPHKLKINSTTAAILDTDVLESNTFFFPDKEKISVNITTGITAQQNVTTACIVPIIGKNHTVLGVEDFGVSLHSRSFAGSELNLTYSILDGEIKVFGTGKSRPTDSGVEVETWTISRSIAIPENTYITGIALVDFEEYEPIDVHVKVEAPATITRYGKNIIKPKLTTSLQGITVRTLDDNTVSVNGSAKSHLTLSICRPTLKPGTYTFSGIPDINDGVTDTDTCFMYMLIQDLKDYKTLGRDFGEGCSFVIENESTLTIQLRINDGYEFDNLIVKPMLEYGEKVSSFENYIEPISQLCTVNGYCEIEALYPSFTLISDTDTPISCEYYRKASSYFDELHYTLPQASSDVLGGVKVGDGLRISNDGVLSTTSTPGGADSTWKTRTIKADSALYIKPEDHQTVLIYESATKDFYFDNCLFEDFPIDFKCKIHVPGILFGQYTLGSIPMHFDIMPDAAGILTYDPFGSWMNINETQNNGNYYVTSVWFEVQHNGYDAITITPHLRRYQE